MQHFKHIYSEKLCYIYKIYSSITELEQKNKVNNIINKYSTDLFQLHKCL